jgi:hypothetical protein
MHAGTIHVYFMGEFLRHDRNHQIRRSGRRSWGRKTLEYLKQQKRRREAVGLSPPFLMLPRQSSKK